MYAIRSYYELENYDNDWSEYNSDNIKEYTQLPKGNYVFRIKAKDMLEAKEATYSYYFTILPAWYESQLAYIFYFILLIASIFLLIVWINKRSKKGALEMEKQKELELKEQKKQYEAETSEKKKEIKELKNQQLQYELRHKSQELASSTMNLIRKNEMLQEIIDNISKVSGELKKSTDVSSILSQLNRMERSIKMKYTSQIVNIIILFTLVLITVLLVACSPSLEPIATTRIPDPTVTMTMRNNFV